MIKILRGLLALALLFAPALAAAQSYKPLVIVGGQITQLPAGATLNVSSLNLACSGLSNAALLKHLMADPDVAYAEVDGCFEPGERNFRRHRFIKQPNDERQQQKHQGAAGAVQDGHPAGGRKPVGG